MADQQPVNPNDHPWGYLLAGILSGLVGVAAIVTGHVGSATVREMAAHGIAGQIVGILFLIIALIYLSGSFKAFRRRHVKKI
jgi:hypothetical protein